MFNGIMLPFFGVLIQLLAMFCLVATRDAFKGLRQSGAGIASGAIWFLPFLGLGALVGSVWLIVAGFLEAGQWALIGLLAGAVIVAALLYLFGPAIRKSMKAT